MLARRGLACDVSRLVRISTATAETSSRLRDAALATALSLPVTPHGPLAGKRVRVSLDGGRVRTRRTRRGRKTAKGRHGFSAPWREPRSEEHTSELQSLTNLVCRLLLEKK